MLNQSRMFMRQAPSFTRSAMFSTGLQRLQEQKTGKNITHFGFRDVAEEEKESLGNIYTKDSIL
jgi:2-methoxy-6-polyprenyl-1,4-benzoquinol methylase